MKQRLGKITTKRTGALVYLVVVAMERVLMVAEETEDRMVKMAKMAPLEQEAKAVGFI